MHRIFDQLSDFAAALRRVCASDGEHPPLPERVVRVRLLYEPTHLEPVQHLAVQAAITAWHLAPAGPVPYRLELREDCGPVLTEPEGASLATRRAQELLQRLELLAVACGLDMRP